MYQSPRARKQTQAAGKPACPLPIKMLCSQHHRPGCSAVAACQARASSAGREPHRRDWPVARHAQAEGTGVLHKPQGSQSRRGKRNRVPEEERPHQASTRQGHGDGVTWEGGPGTGRGGGTGYCSTQTSPCSGGTPCQGRSPHAP